MTFVETAKTLIFETPHAVQAGRGVQNWRPFGHFVKTFSKTPFGRPPEKDFEDSGAPVGVQWELVLG